MNRQLGGLQRAGLVAGLATVLLLAGCSRNYGPQGDGNVDGTGPNSTTNVVIDGERRVPFIDQIGEANALHLPPNSDSAVVDLGADRHAVFAGPYSLVWDSEGDRVVSRLYGTSLSSSTEVVWMPGDGTSALLRNGAAFYWIDAVKGRTTRFEFAGPVDTQVLVFDDAFVMLEKGDDTRRLAEFYADSGRVERRFETTLSSVWRNSLESVGDLYHYRDETGAVQVRPVGSNDESVSVGSAFRIEEFGDGRYLYLEADRPWLFDTVDGAEVEFPQQWRLYIVNQPQQDWVYLQNGTRIAFWRPGAELVEVEQPATDSFIRFDYAFVDPDFGVVYADTTDGDLLVIYGFDSQEWYEIPGVEGGPVRTRPTTAKLPNGEPIVIWAGQHGDSLEGAHFWTPEGGVKPLSGFRDILNRFERTTDPNRFVAFNQSSRLVLADIQRQTMIELGQPVNCENGGLSHDGRRALTYVDQTVSLFDADDLSTRVIARNPVFFGERCEESFNRALSRGLYLSAFDGKVGDLVFWNGDVATDIVNGISNAGAVLDPVRGTWTLAAPTNRSVYLAVFEAEGQILTEVGKASASNLNHSYDYDGQQFVFLDTTENDPLRSTIYRQDVATDPEPVAIASGAFARVHLLGDDILAWNADDEAPSNVILSTNTIDPGPLEGALWTGEDDGELRPPGAAERR